MTYTRPGVYVSEGPFATTVPTGSAVAPTAFIGATSRGPVTPTRIDSWNQYKTIYGDLTNSSDIGYAVYHFFANGGRTAYVTRVTGADDNKATSDPVLDEDNGLARFRVVAKSPGTWANYVAETGTTVQRGLAFILSQGLRNGISESLPSGTGAPATFNMAVFLNGNQVENWTEVSLDPDANQYLPTIVNNYSKYVDIVDYATGAGAVTAGASFTLSYGLYYLSGASVNAIVDGDWEDAVDRLESISGQLLINLVGQTAKSRVDYATSYAETRGNGFVIIDPQDTAVDNSTITSLVDSYNKSSYGAVFYPMLKMPDPARSGAATLRDTYPGGAIAGLFTRVEGERTTAKAPAGYNYDIRGAYGLSTPFTDAQIGALYETHVNTLKSIPGGAVIINGSRTLRRTDITKFIPVRRSLNFIKTNVENIANYAVFEPNSQRVWTDIKVRLSQFLADFWVAGGLKGNSASEAFYIICDETNNPPYSIENGELHVEVGVSMQSPAEFIIININQFAGGITSTVENL
jgi:hypothetical protein